MKTNYKSEEPRCHREDDNHIGTTPLFHIGTTPYMYDGFTQKQADHFHNSQKIHAKGLSQITGLDITFEVYAEGLSPNATNAIVGGYFRVKLSVGDREKLALGQNKG